MAEMVPFVHPETGEELHDEGNVLTTSSGRSVPLIRGVPRFVASDAYAENFGLQWNIHATVQLESHPGTTATRTRLERCLGGPVSALEGLRVLEAGCGAGRFTELTVKSGALVHAFDLSSAVDANQSNIGDRPNYRVAQADIVAPPFPPSSFDLVLCLGVLQHTPNTETSLHHLWRMVKPGGALVIDHYAWNLSRVTKLAPLVRQIVKRLPTETAKRVSDGLVQAFFPLHWAIRDVTINGAPVPQMILSRISPVMFYYRSFPTLTRGQHLEWSQLDTYDSLACTYERLWTPAQIRRTLETLGATEIVVWKGGNGVEARCRKPNAPTGGVAGAVN